jgi:AcrR family transcriptional regulator
MEFNWLMAIKIHPTKALLISTTVTLLETKLPGEIAVDEILEASGISKGSLYHHFEDLGELLEAAQVEIYAAWVDRSVEALVGLLAKVKTREDIVTGLKLVTRFTQDKKYSNTRFQRARAIAAAEHNPRFKKRLAEEQTRLTDALIDLINEARNKGLYAKDFDAHAGAVLVQAYTLGMIVDDFVVNQMDPEAWYDLIDKVVDKVFLV